MNLAYSTKHPSLALNLKEVLLSTGTLCTGATNNGLIILSN